MLFNSIDFLIFFPVVVLLYLIIPKQGRTVWLLAASYYFYMCWNPKYALLILLSTVITYASGLLLARCRSMRGKKGIVALSFITNLGILALFKYANFFLDSIAALCGAIGLSFPAQRLDLLLPVGISFYTFQALSYTADVYRGTIGAEKNFIDYALFVSFFPQLVAGPIERSGNLLTQIKEITRRNLCRIEDIRDGLLLMLWGLFQKLVIADRAAVLVRNVYGNYSSFGFAEIVIATVLFALQIYCDFGGYSNIARGAASVLGIRLMQNFKQPYLAADIRDFWRRWHISLTSWFTDYLYIPLGGNRKGTVRKYLNILIVFLTSGLWHGASWNYVMWGAIHGVYRVLGDLKGRACRSSAKPGLLSRIMHTAGTFMLVCFAWIFFAADDLRHALAIIARMFSHYSLANIHGMGLSRNNEIILAVAALILFIVDLLHEKGISVFTLYHARAVWLRYALCLGLIWFTIMFGIYGVDYDATQFIYFQF